MVSILLYGACLFMFAEDAGAATADIDQAIRTIQAVGPDGKGAAEAARAWTELAKADVRQVPAVLAAMKGASPLACNWLRSAVDAILERAQAENRPLPLEELERFLLDAGQHPHARQRVYALLVEKDKAAEGRYLPRMLDDPAPDLRRLAVAQVLEAAEKAFQGTDRPQALALYQKAFAAARDRDQLDRGMKRLRELGQAVDMQRHLGMVADWKLLGPFPNPEERGIDAVYPPEKGIDLKGEYAGLGGPIRWVDYQSRDDYGIIDLNAALKSGEEGTGYAYAEFGCESPHDVEIRLGAYTQFKLWLNGREILDRRDAYTGMKLDHYVARVRLDRGKNTLLVKITKQKPPGPLPNHWRFQLRVCDSAGVAVLSTTRPPTLPAEKKGS